MAAGVGSRLKGFTDKPKCLIRITKEPLIVRNIRLLKKSGIKEAVVVVGYKSDDIIKTVKRHGLEVRFVKNDDFTDGSILSLWRAAGVLKGDILIMDADLYFEESVARSIARSKKDSFFLIDSTVRGDKEAVMVGFEGNRAVALERGLKGDYKVLGEWAGFLKLSGAAAAKLKKLLARKIAGGEKKMGYEFLIPELFDKVRISYELIDGSKWVEIDFPKDVRRAKDIKMPKERNLR